MPYTVTIQRPGAHDPAQRAVSVEVADDVEGARIAQEGAVIAQAKGEYVTYEVHDPHGQLVVSYTSAFTSV